MLEATALTITHRDERVEWKIENFSSLSKEVDNEIESPTFFLSSSRWYLSIRPNGNTRNMSEGWVGLYVFKKATSEECSVAYKLGVKLCVGSELLLVENKKIFQMEGEGWGIPKCFRRSTLESSNNILDWDGSLTVFCTLRIESTQDAEFQTPSPSYGIPTLAQDYKSLYLDKKYTDIIIKVKNKELFAHKCILAARSKVFAAMFEHDMTEKGSGTVEVDDCDPNSFEDFIIYLYTGNLDVVSTSNAPSLYKDADKYDAAELKEECARIMARDLSVETFCDVVHIATVHNESDLLTTATAFFTKNLTAILQTVKWQEFLTENPIQGNELFLKAAAKLNNE